MIRDIFFPAKCPVCDKPVIPHGRMICKKCDKTFGYICEPFCKKCGKQMTDEFKEYCHDCMNKEHLFDYGISLYDYKTVQEALFRFKYQGRPEYADYFGRDIVKRYRSEIERMEAEVLIPVPLYRRKELKRGYNQSELVARVVGKAVNIPVDTTLIKRVVDTKPQKTLDDMERQNNLKKAFIIARNDVKLSKVIIVDDVYTTGSTMDAVSRILRSVGVKRICFLTIASGSGV